MKYVHNGSKIWADLVRLSEICISDALFYMFQVFMEQKHSDEKLLSKSVDVNSHHDLFQGIYHKVSGHKHGIIWGMFSQILQ